MDKIYLIGDLHGNSYSIKHFIKNNSKLISKNTTIIVLGDFGANVFLDERDNDFKKELKQSNITYFVVRGNHEERPSNIYRQYPKNWHIERYFAGDVYVENKYPYIKYVADMPFQYNINGHLCLTLPGAYSVDKYIRLKNGWPWYKDEQMNNDEMFIGEMITNAIKEWDIVLSHTCPITYEPTDLFLSNIDQSMVDKTMERYLDKIEQKINYKLWAWGHYHNTRIYPQFDESNRVMLYKDFMFDLNKFFETNNPYNALIKIL